MIFGEKNLPSFLMKIVNNVAGDHPVPIAGALRRLASRNGGLDHGPESGGQQRILRRKRSTNSFATETRRTLMPKIRHASGKAGFLGFPDFTGFYWVSRAANSFATLKKIAIMSKAATLVERLHGCSLGAAVFFVGLIGFQWVQFSLLGFLDFTRFTGLYCFSRF